MIALLRAAALVTNVAVVAGVPILLGASPLFAGVCLVVFFPAVAWATAHPPPSAPAEDDVVARVRDVAQGMGAPAPHAVRMVEGASAAVGRVGFGYQLLLGRSLEARHRDAVVAHELAHVITGDLLWEPFTDGPARLFARPVCAFAPFWVLLFPFFLFGVPLARLTELRADRLAARVVESYPIVLKELTADGQGRVSLLYPPVTRRLDYAARDSLLLGNEP
ncbi:MAG: M48 family metalloprotease [Planctomycetota bacterium]|jgi:Zn-dependent protease with chaperone function